MKKADKKVTASEILNALFSKEFSMFVELRTSHENAFVDYQTIPLVYSKDFVRNVLQDWFEDDEIVAPLLRLLLEKMNEENKEDKCEYCKKENCRSEKCNKKYIRDVNKRMKQAIRPSRPAYRPQTKPKIKCQTIQTDEQK